MAINHHSAISQVRLGISEAEEGELSRQLCTLLRAESARSGRPWVQFSRLAELYRLQYGKVLVQQFKQAGYADSCLFWRDHQQVFSTYATPDSGNPYVAVFEMVNPTQDFRWSDRPPARRRRKTWPTCP
ncbi:hypothetical protein P7L53_13860 [Thermoleptolyngbya sichuanensis XZ-Cy5]|uniref:hypothetical protein n=1 Tax=Thermoleptolyngbya sichuanensis TaxID=2885951 RepID=UPI00240E22D4|nr:hypothetical protein [Thermoleptolyngbya sichuanensis]MDG2617325.1 hypothetical protein [Thermoleptolyngbya sichuanensis XZ-Cy5]